MWRARISYLMLLPFLIPFVVFIIIPAVNSAYLSLTEYSGSPTAPPEYVGTANFIDLLSLEIVEQPLLIDEETGEAMFQCRRDRIPASEVAAFEAAEGVTCAPAYVRARELLPEGYSEFRQFSIFNRTFMIGARDPRFWTAIFNTLVYVALVVAWRSVLGLALALALRRQTRINMALRIIFFLPSVTATIAVTVIWGWIFRGASYGLINAALLQTASIQQPIAFLNDAAWTMPVLVDHGGVGRRRLFDGTLPRRVAEHSQRIVRSRRHRWGEFVSKFLATHAAAAAPYDAVRGRHGRDRRVSSL